MDIYKFLKLKGTAPSKIDEAAYELIAFELSQNQVKQGLWTKALADSEWNDSKAKTYYVKMRHEQLIEEINSAVLTKDIGKIASVHQEAIDYGLSKEDIDYLGVPIKAIRYLEKYGKSKDQVSRAISKKQLAAVMKDQMLWVSDKPI